MTAERRNRGRADIRPHFDKYGLGRVMSIEDDGTLIIDFGTQKVRITTPCAKLTKL